MTMQGAELKAIRKDLGFTQQDLAECLGMSRKAIVEMERGIAPIEDRTELAARQIYNEESRLFDNHQVVSLDDDIPLAEAMVLWDREERPRIKVVRHGEDDTRYSSSFGACDQDWLIAGEVGQKLRLLSRFIQLTVQEGIAPRTVHGAFSVIPEYRYTMGVNDFEAGVRSAIR